MAISTLVSSQPPKLSSLSKPFGMQTTTPMASVMRPNTTINTAYGGAGSVPTGQYTNNPSSNLNLRAGGGLMTPTPTTPLASRTTPSVSSPNSGGGTGGGVTGTPTQSTTPPTYYGGKVTDYGRSIGLVDTPPINPSTSPTTSTQGLLTYPSLVGGVAKQANTINDTAGNIGAAGQMTPEEVAARQQLAILTGQQGADIANIENHPSDLNFQMGREAVLNRNVQAQQTSLGQKIAAYAAERTASQGAYTAEAGAEQGAGGLISTAAGLTKPEANFPFVFNPATGTFAAPGVGGGGSGGGTGIPNLTYNPNTDAQSLAQAVMSNQIGIDDAVTSLGYGGKNTAAAAQLNAAILSAGGNPTTLRAVNEQNLTQGKTYQGIAQELSNALQTMKPIGDKLVQFISTTGQNPATAPLVNEQISKINAQLYPAQVATLNAAVNDIRSYAIQILGSQSGANPVDVTSGVNSFDFSKFSAQDLSSFLGDLQNLGSTRLSQAQSAMSAGYGANNGGATPAAGMIATEGGAYNTGGMTPSSFQSNLGKALLGTVANVTSAAAKAAGGAVSAGVGGVIGGAAERLFVP